MKSGFTFLLAVGLGACLASCSIVRPDGSLKDVVEGEVFAGDSTKAVSPGNNPIMDPLDTGGPVRWKVEF